MQTHIVQPVRLSIEFITCDRLQLILQVLFIRHNLSASANYPLKSFNPRQTHLESLVLIISPPDILGQLLELLDLLLVLPLETTSDLFHELVIVHIGPGVPDDLGLAGQEVEFEELEEGREGLFLFSRIMERNKTQGEVVLYMSADGTESGIEVKGLDAYEMRGKAD